MKRRLRSRSLWSGAALLVSALLVSVLPAPAALAWGSAKSSSFTVAISPVQATVGQPTTFTLTLTNATTSSNSMGSAQVVVPAGFTDVTLGTTTSPSGWAYSLATCSTDSPTGCGTPGSTLVEVSTPDERGAKKVAPGRTLSLSITATPTASGRWTWAAAVKNSDDWSEGQRFSQSGTNPQVTVKPGPPAHLSVTGPTGDVGAGAAFNVTATVTDAYGNLVDPVTVNGQVDVAGGSQVSASTVDGQATLALDAPTRPGVYTVTVTVTGTGLSQSSSFTVVPGPPTHLTIDSVSDPMHSGTLSLLASGKPFDVQVTARDAYDNASAYAGAVTLTATGHPGDPSVGVLATLSQQQLDPATTLSEVTYSGVGLGVTLIASAPGLGPDATTSVDVNAFVTQASGTPGVPIDPSLLTVPGRATADLGNGANGTVSLLVSACGTDPTPCSAGTQVQLSGSFKDASGHPLYGFGTPSSPLKPARIDWQCSAIACPHPDLREEPRFAKYNYWGNDEGREEFSSYPVYVSLHTPAGDLPFAEAPACVPSWNRWTTGRILTSQAQAAGFCIDVNAITRAGNSFTGTLSMPLLFVEDPRLRP